jgi:hypothetical protein
MRLHKSASRLFSFRGLQVRVTKPALKLRDHTVVERNGHHSLWFDDDAVGLEINQITHHLATQFSPPSNFIVGVLPFTTF